MTNLRKAFPIAAACSVLGLVVPTGASAGTLSPVPAGRLSVVAGNGNTGTPTPGPATKSALDQPRFLAVDAHGDLFIADSLNNVVEEVTPAGRLSVVAGNGKEDPPTPGPAIKSGIHGPSGVAVDAHGDLFISDLETCVVDEVTPAGTLSVVAGVAGKRGPPTPGPPPVQSLTRRAGWRWTPTGICSSPPTATKSWTRSPPLGGCRWWLGWPTRSGRRRRARHPLKA